MEKKEEIEYSMLLKIKGRKENNGETNKIYR